jgi:hypothetical protein
LDIGNNLYQLLRPPPLWTWDNDDGDDKSERKSNLMIDVYSSGLKVFRAQQILFYGGKLWILDSNGIKYLDVDQNRLFNLLGSEMVHFIIGFHGKLWGISHGSLSSWEVLDQSHHSNASLNLSQLVSLGEKIYAFKFDKSATIFGKDLQDGQDKSFELVYLTTTCGNIIYTCQCLVIKAWSSSLDLLHECKGHSKQIRSIIAFQEKLCSCAMDCTIRFLHQNLLND